jgi:formylglycine-generating enzyme required for sulfatase activity
MDRLILGDYKIVRPMGQGPLGMVFLAEHRFMKKRYLLKVLPEELASEPGFIQRFEEDIAVLATLDHPNIVKIHNISCSDGLYFIVMDFIGDGAFEAMNLSRYVMSLEGKMDERSLFDLLKQVAGALDFAHGKKIDDKEIVHFNLKPNNILVVKRQVGVDVFVADFGLSRIVGSGAVLSRTYKNVAEALNIGASDRYPNPAATLKELTPLHASFLQNYAFLAPEQKRLDSPYPVDRQADCYAFGVLAYFLLMNELPEGCFEMPSSKSEYRFKWDQLLFHCLQRNPSKRPSHLVEALESVATGEVASTDSLRNDGSSFHPRAVVENESAAQFLVPNIPQFEKLESCLVASQVSEGQVVSDVLATDLKKQSPTQLRPALTISRFERPKEDLDPGAVFLIDSSVKSYHPEHRDFTNVQPLLTEMAVVNGSSFYRGSRDGSRDELPRHQITVSSFAIDIHPVTNEQFVRFLEIMGGEKDGNHNDIIRLRDSRIKRSGGKLSIESGYTKHPVVGVTWYGAYAYAKWVGKRLPSEAEWEIAARGGKECALYPTGEDIEKSQANFFSADTTAVMSYAPNGYDLFDMAGNVYEWCLDWYGYNYYEVSVQEPDNPQGPLQGVYRVLRGGCWKSLKEDLRCSRRHRNNPGTVNGTYGFRCAADVQVS